MKTIFFIFIFILTFSFLNATIINVPADQPTIQAGINVASDTDTVLVQPGTYFENINYYELAGINKKDLTVSFINQKGDESKENLIESRLIDFESAIKNLSDKYELNEILNQKDAPYALALIRNNMYEGRFKSRSLVGNLSALSFMQNRVRFIEYQILSKLQN